MQHKQSRNKVLVRVTTIPLSLEKLLTGQMKFMSEHGFTVHMISSGLKTNALTNENCNYIKVDMTRVISPVKDLISLFRLITIFRKLRPAIVHSHTPKAGLLSMMAAKLTGVPIRLHTVAGLPLMEAKGAKRLLLEIVEKIAYMCCTKVYPNSNNLKDFILSSKFARPEKLKVIGHGSSNGIDTEYFKLTDQVKLQGEAISRQLRFTASNFIFCFIGRIVKDKGIDELVCAFIALHSRYPLLQLLLIGPFEKKLDPVDAATEQLILNHPAIKWVDFQNDIRPYLAISQALVFPSYREGFPNVPMQAGCFHLPSIVTNINGCNEIVANEKNGLIVPVKNAIALEDAMERLVADKTLYQHLQSNARPMIVTRYEQRVFWNQLLKEYDEQING